MGLLRGEPPGPRRRTEDALQKSAGRKRTTLRCDGGTGVQPEKCSWTFFGLCCLVSMPRARLQPTEGALPALSVCYALWVETVCFSPDAGRSTTRLLALRFGRALPSDPSCALLQKQG